MNGLQILQKGSVFFIRAHAQGQLILQSKNFYTASEAQDWALQYQRAQKK